MGGGGGGALGLCKHRSRRLGLVPFRIMFWDAPYVELGVGWKSATHKFPFGIKMTSVVSVNMSTAKAFIRSFFN